jgi:gliding motility-associated-like protein
MKEYHPIISVAKKADFFCSGLKPAALILLFLLWAADMRAIFTVTNTNDSGAGSLRLAIEEANKNPGLDSISFNIPGAGPHTITLFSALPTITDTVFIDGASEPDFINTPVVRIDGASAGSVNGLTFGSTSDGSTVRSLMITRFGRNGIQVDLRADGITIAGNWIGSTGTGSISVGNSDNGINVQGANTIIGGTGDHDQNVITNNGNEGINLTGNGSAGTVIRGNIIGLDPDGSTGSGNGDVGIAALWGANNTTIGGATAAERNIISMNYEGIELNSTNNLVQGNYIGTDVTGALIRGNRSDDGIEINSISTGNLIGGTGPGMGNLVSGNSLDGIKLNGPSNTVVGNIIGLDATGTIDLGNGRYGIRVAGVANNTIGGTEVTSRNIISGNGNLGILLAGSSGTIIQGNYIGTDITGSVELGNTSAGLMLDSQASDNTIGGAVAGAGNLISGNNNHGVYLVAGCNNNVLQGNIIGLNVSGTAALGNASHGIMISSAGNTIGGTTSETRNVISSNSSGISFSGEGATGNLLRGNYIGTDINGTADLGNNADGVVLSSGASNNTIGGTVAGAGNLISGNNSDGIEISGAFSTGNVIQGNYIGTDATGTEDLGNTVAGIRPNGSDNTIGGETETAGNVISGNSSGITIGSGSGDVIKGNYIGTNASATAGIGNTFGMWITGGDSILIGGTAAGAGNVISGNHQYGIHLIGAGSKNIMIQGNYIGTNTSGNDVGNGSAGILVSASAATNQLGGPQQGAGNTIAFNGGDGIWLNSDAGTHNAILGNSIHSNAGIGIDLLNDQVTANDKGDADTGPNDLQNYPLLEEAVLEGGNTTITGSLNSVADTTFRIEFFSSALSDPTGNGEGQTYLGFDTVTTDGIGNAAISTTLVGVAVAAGHFVTATATVDLGNGFFGRTSEFSANVLASHAPAANNTPCDAEELMVDQNCFFQVYSNVGATDSGIPLTECEGYAGGDLWFKVAVPASGNLIITLESDALEPFPDNDGWAHRLGLAVYGGSCNNPVYDTCWIEQDGPGIPQSPEMILTNYTPGDTLFLRVWEYGNDDNGEFRICVFTDDVNPTIICPADTSGLSDPGTCLGALALPAPAVDDNFGIGSVLNDYNGTSDASDLYPAGTTTITWTVTDLVGNTAYCIQHIFIADNEPPVMNCPDNLAAVCDLGEQPAYANYAAFLSAGGWVADNCEMDTSSFVLLGEESTGSHCPDTVTRTYQIADTSGNTALCQQLILIHDLIPPTASNPDSLTVTCIGDLPLPDVLVITDEADNCTAVPQVTFLGDEQAGSCPMTITRTYRVTDDCGNSIDVSHIISVQDNINPVFDATPGDLTAICDISEHPAYEDFASFAAAGGSATDNCGIDSSSFILAEEHTDGQGYPVTVTRTYRIDDLCGNTVTYNQDITLSDIEDPVIECISEITQSSDPGSCISWVTVPAPVTHDNCGISSIINDFNGGADASGTYPAGTTQVTWTVTDLNGHTAFCSQQVIITDNEAPEIFCPGTQTAFLDGNCTFVIPDYAVSTGVTDNCDPNPLLVQTPLAGTVLTGSGTIQEIILQARDSAGNESECRFDILLSDNSPPETVPGRDTLIVLGEGIYKAYVNLPTPEFTDNCGVQSIINDFNGGEDASGEYSFGTTSVIYTVTDVNGNISSLTQLVTLTSNPQPEWGLIIPEGFSPNEDGLNDRFEILGLEQYPQNELRIFNVHGNEVYSMAGYDNSWDGTSASNLNKGARLPTGTYYYALYLGMEGAIIKGFVYLRRE